jgi:predicted aspartyl protease
MTYTYPYNEQYIPAFPVADIEIWAREDKSLAVTALLDSGSDATMIPIRFLQQVRARKGKRMRVHVLGNHSYMTDSYRISLRMAGTMVQLSVLADHFNEQVILGRDVLNYLVVTLNGVAHMVEITE